jgi:hypothetical protein
MIGMAFCACGGEQFLLLCGGKLLTFISELAD